MSLFYTQFLLMCDFVVPLTLILCVRVPANPSGPENNWNLLPQGHTVACAPDDET
jgi:hypothetical protein